MYLIYDNVHALCLKRYYWDPTHKKKIRANFEHRGSVRMSDMFKDIRDQIHKKPKWIGERAWEGLKAYWLSPDFKGKSAVNTANRHSDVGGFTHTGGSINANESKRRLVRTFYLINLSNMF